MELYSIFHFIPSTFRLLLVFHLVYFLTFFIFLFVVFGLFESHNPRKSCRAAYNNIRRAFVAFCWVLKLLPICLWLATILVVSFLSLPRFYFPASVPALSIYGQPWSMGWARTPVWALDGWRFGGFFAALPPSIGSAFCIFPGLEQGMEDCERERWQPGSWPKLSLSFEVSLNGFLSVAVFGLPETGNSQRCWPSFCIRRTIFNKVFIHISAGIFPRLSLAITLQVIALFKFLLGRKTFPANFHSVAIPAASASNSVFGLGARSSCKTSCDLQSKKKSTTKNVQIKESLCSAA